MKRRKAWHAWPFVVLLLIIGVLIALGFSFFRVWQTKGANNAEVYGAFLQFVAASIVAVITLVYVYYTRRALKESRRANRLQWTQWQQKVTVKPKFWVENRGSREWYKSLEGTNHLEPLGVYADFFCVVWNYSEQSVLIESVLVERIDRFDLSFPVDAIRRVLRPHSDDSIDISREITHLLAGTFARSVHSDVLNSYPDKDGEIKISLTYTDWQHTATEVASFKVQLLRQGGIPSKVVRVL